MKNKENQIIEQKTSYSDISDNKKSTYDYELEKILNKVLSSVFT